jgi:hypothetical protein
MYAQKIEGNLWAGEKIDKGKIDKMNGKVLCAIGNGSGADDGFGQISSWGRCMSSCRL